MLEENLQVQKFQNIIGNVLNELEENAGLYLDQKLMTHSFRFNSENNALVMISSQGGVICYGSSVHPMGQIKLNASPMEFLQSVEDFKKFFEKERSAANELIENLAIQKEQEQMFDITKDNGDRPFIQEPSEEIKERSNNYVVPYSESWLKARHLDDCKQIIRWYNHPIEAFNPDFAGQDLYQTNSGDFYMHRHGMFDDIQKDEVFKMSDGDVIQFLMSDFNWNTEGELHEFISEIGIKSTTNLTLDMTETSYSKLKEKLEEKLHNELSQFENKMLEMPKDQLIGAIQSYDNFMRHDIVYHIEQDQLEREEMAVLLSFDNTLDVLCKKFKKDYTDLTVPVKELVVKLTETYQLENGMAAPIVESLDLKIADEMVEYVLEDVSTIVEAGEQANIYLEEFELDEYIPESEMTSEQILNLKKHKGRTDVLDLGHQGLDLD